MTQQPIPQLRVAASFMTQQPIPQFRIAANAVQTPARARLRSPPNRGLDVEPAPNGALKQVLLLGDSDRHKDAESPKKTDREEDAQLHEEIGTDADDVVPNQDSRVGNFLRRRLNLFENESTDYSLYSSLSQDYVSNFTYVYEIK